jgi:hypothetical protein
MDCILLSSYTCTAPYAWLLMTDSDGHAICHDNIIRCLMSCQPITSWLLLLGLHLCSTGCCPLLLLLCILDQLQL